MASGGKTTPMMKQYLAMRRELPEDVLLLFRLGDFYEMFLEDAKVASPILNVALTMRNGIPMCGVPHHAAQGYIAKLIKAGKRAAIAEQVGEVRPGKVVDREITQVISAGTVSDMNLLESDRPNYLAAVHREKKVLGLAALDHTTGEFTLAEFADGESLSDELERLRPSEILIADDGSENGFADVERAKNAQPYDGYAFLSEQALHTITEHYSVQSLDGFGCGTMTAAIGAAGAILHYLKYQLRRSVDNIQNPRVYEPDGFVLIDSASQRNLDLIDSRGGRDHTLLKALDRTATPMGARKLRHWILHPLRQLEPLVGRQDLIASLLDESYILSKCREALGPVRDIERTVGRLSHGSGNARDLRVLSASLGAIPELRSHIESLGVKEGSLAQDLLQQLHEFSELVDVLETAIEDEPPASVKEGGIFRDGYRENLDELRKASTEGKKWIADLQVRESERTGVKSLKVKYNAVFGYFIEITKSNLHLVPDDYTRKQTTVNAERFITPELKEVENKILGADERAKNLEYEEFLNLRESVIEHLKEIQETADAMATVDVLCGLAETAQLFGYVRPLLNNSKNLFIRDGRHPVLDQNVAEEKFVPNDTHLDGEENRLLIITGPNMAGKSTYIRQVALVTLMAQIGSYVPAASAEIGIVDRIFTRVGASDDISRGQSTFMVEMNETALIVNNATDRSLVILDEIGRGTSTFDGLSIAWSVAEFLHDEIRARTLFATHYHELTDLSRSRPGIQNYNIAVREWNDQIIFLRKIVAGAADKSYGIQVARLAGLPQSIVSRAKDLLAHLEENVEKARPEREKGSRGKRKKTSAGENDEDIKPDSPSPQLTLFS